MNETHFFFVPSRLIHRARAGAARVAAAAARAHRPIGERFRGAAGLRGEHGHQLLQIGALAGRARRRLAVASQIFEVRAAAAAFVFKKRHRDILQRADPEATKAVGQQARIGV